jgi:hypothetical protein
MVSASPSLPASLPAAIPSTGPAAARPGRRRQRSVRVTVAVALLVLATVLVALALPGQSPLWLSLAAVHALASGWAAARIVWNELAQSRREAAADRAAQAAAYRGLFAERASEHAEFTTAMTDRLVRRDRDVAALQAGVAAAKARATEAEARVQREARRANDALERANTAREEAAALARRVEDLETAREMAQEMAQELAQEMARAERDDELAVWQPDAVPLTGATTGSLDRTVTGQLTGLDGVDVDAVVDLIAWEERVSAGARRPVPEQKHA